MGYSQQYDLETAAVKFIYLSKSLAGASVGETTSSFNDIKTHMESGENLFLTATGTLLKVGLTDCWPGKCFKVNAN